MKRDMDLLYTGSSFSSKEISFMKSDSDAISHSDFSPEHYLSDFLFKQEVSDNHFSTSLDAFIKDVLLKLDQNKSALAEKRDTVSDERFTCAVIRLTSEERSSEKNQVEAVVHQINAALLEQKSAVLLWQWLSESTLAVAIWGDPVVAQETLRSLVELISESADTRCHAGAALFPFMEFLPEDVPYNAVKALDHAAFSAPGTLTFFDDVTQNIYGDRLYQLGRVEEAAREYEKGLYIKSDNINLLNSLGVCYSLMNRLEPALEQFRKAIAFYKSGQVENKDNTLRQDNLLRQDDLLRESDMVGEESQYPLPGQLEPYSEMDGNEFMLLYNAALISSLMDDLENGISYIKQATAITGDFFEAELTAGILLLKAGVTDESLVHLENAASLKPGSGMVHRILGELYLQTDLPAKAVHEYTTSIKLNPYDACAISGLAKAFEVLDKNLDIALDLALHSLMISPDNPWFRMRLARIYMKKGDSASADIEFSKAEALFKAADHNHCKEEVQDTLIASSSDGVTRQEIKCDKVEMERVFQYDDEKKIELKKRSA